MTVMAHRAHVMRKKKADAFADLVIMAIRRKSRNFPGNIGV